MLSLKRGSRASAPRLPFSGGQAASISTRQPAGHYEIQPCHLTITLPRPAIAGEESWEMVARLILPESRARSNRLTGVIEAILPGEPETMTSPWALVRRHESA